VKVAIIGIAKLLYITGEGVAHLESTGGIFRQLGWNLQEGFKDTCQQQTNPKLLDVITFQNYFDELSTTNLRYHER
jgi:hypothetical protein